MIGGFELGVHVRSWLGYSRDGGRLSAEDTLELDVGRVPEGRPYPRGILSSGHRNVI